LNIPINKYLPYYIHKIHQLHEIWTFIPGYNNLHFMYFGVLTVKGDIHLGIVCCSQMYLMIAKNGRDFYCSRSFVRSGNKYRHWFCRWIWSFSGGL